MAIFRALAIYAVENVPMKQTLTFEQARKVQENNDVVSLLKSLNIDKEKVYTSEQVAYTPPTLHKFRRLTCLCKKTNLQF